VIVNVLPPMVSVPVRDVVPVFAEVLNVTDPLPEPLAPLVTVTHVSVVVADQAQPVGAVTEIVPGSPAAATDCDTGEIAYVQATPGCVTEKVWPPTVIVALRDVAVVFAAPVKLTVPLPDPLAPAVIVIHVSVVVAVHAQPACAVTPIAPEPPPAATDSDAGEIEYAHGAPGCVTVKLLKPTVIVAVRAIVLGFAAAVNPTDPLPEPLAPDVIVIHRSAVLAVHAQADAAVTAIVPVPPPAATACDVGEIVYVQLTPACVTVNA
jgi:hypothetical protein